MKTLTPKQAQAEKENPFRWLSDSQLFLAIDNQRPGALRNKMQQESDRRHAAARASYAALMAEHNISQPAPGFFIITITATDAANPYLN